KRLDAIDFASSREPATERGLLAHPRTRWGDDLMDSQKMMGFTVPGDQRIPVPSRDWSAMKLALWRSKVAWEIAVREAAQLVERCSKMEGCAGKRSETALCFPDCPDRELRMSGLVILNAARQFAPIEARKPADGPYFAPTREYFSAVMAELAAA